MSSLDNISTRNITSSAFLLVHTEPEQLREWALKARNIESIKSVSDDLLAALDGDGDFTTATRNFIDAVHIDGGWERATKDTVMLPSENSAKSALRKFLNTVTTYTQEQIIADEALMNLVYNETASLLSCRFFHHFNDLNIIHERGDADYFLTYFDAKEPGTFVDKVRCHAEWGEIIHVKMLEPSRHQRTFPELYETCYRNATTFAQQSDHAFCLFFEVALPGNEFFHFFYNCSHVNQSWNFIPKETFQTYHNVDALTSTIPISCWNCKSVHQGMKTCAKCQTAKYCSKECQKAHWKTHKQMCNIP
jgi:hypothetical protein